eukprot:3577916-Amphidinium_carterae.2
MLRRALAASTQVLTRVTEAFALALPRKARFMCTAMCSRLLVVGLWAASTVPQERSALDGGSFAWQSL